MLKPGRLVHTFAVVCCAAFALGQGSAGNYGQGQGGAPGGFGGGFGGGMGAGGLGGDFERSKDDKRARPDEDDSRGLWESKTAILTPGDRVEFKLKMRKGETLFAGATSDAFDPALSVEDSKGAVLKKNDDRAEGDQSPFVGYRFAEEGTYTLKVLSYRSVSGGKFTVKMRTFLASDAPLGSFVHKSVDLSGGEDSGSPVVFRLTAKKDKVYDLRRVSAMMPYGSYESRLLRIVGPTGVEANDFTMIATPDSTPLIVALADGDFYLEYGSNGVKQFKTEYREVAVLNMIVGGEQPVDLEPGELKVLEFQVKPDQIIRTILTGPSIAQSVSAPAAAGSFRSGDTADGSYGNNRYWTWFKMNRDSDSDIVRVFHGTGAARLVLRSTSAAAQKVTVKNTESLPTWAAGEPVKSAIDIGDSRLFLIKSTKSELMRVFAGASHFQPKLDIYRMSGEIANSLGDRKTHTAADDLYFPDADTFLVRLSCDGHGGSGDFTMKRDSLSPAPYALGTPQTMTLDGANFGLYSVELQAGKRYQLTTDEPGRFLRADLLDDDGQFLISQKIGFDKVDVQYFVPKRSGRHRLWLRGAPGVRRFKFELHTPPSIGGV